MNTLISTIRDYLLLKGGTAEEALESLEILERKYIHAKAANTAYINALDRPVQINVYYDGKVEESQK